MLTDTARAQLFNCCTDYAAPDWSQFDWLEIGGCITETNAAGETWTNGGEPDDHAEFWTVYGHLHVGGMEAITDAPNRAAADYVANTLAMISGLSVDPLSPRNK